MLRLRKVCRLLALLPIFAQAQQPVIRVIDPPNWYAAMPKPMLLLHGDSLSGTIFSLSDRSLKLARTETSKNGHWAQLSLETSPAKPETIKITARNATGQTSAPYTFAPRRAATDGAAVLPPLMCST